MTHPETAAPAGAAEAWRPSKARAAVLIVAVAIAASQWVRVIRDPGADFALHWDFGQRFRDGQWLYRDGTHRPYPPFWGMVNVPMTVVPMARAQPLLYPAGLLALAGLTAVLAGLTRRALPLGYARTFWATALAIALASRFLVRELGECGPNLIVVALCWAGFALWRRRREGLGGAALGLAIALKCTPALFVAYYALKRQWRMVASSTLFAAAFTLAPIAWQGPTQYLAHMRYWIGTAALGLSQADPTVGVLGPEEVKNVSLRPVLGRLLVRLPEGHLGRIESAWQLEGLGVPPAVAGWVVKATMLALLLGVARAFRRPARDRGDLAVVWEAAAVSLLMLLYSPLTWKQHCVGAYPALYLIARTAVARRGLPRWMAASVGIYAATVVGLDRGVVGKAMNESLDSFGVTTWALLLVLAVALACRSRAGAGPGRDALPKPHASGAVGRVTARRAAPGKNRPARSPYHDPA